MWKIKIAEQMASIKVEHRVQIRERQNFYLIALMVGKLVTVSGNAVSNN